MSTEHQTEKEYQKLRSTLNTVDDILEYITRLDQARSGKDLDRILPGLLGSLGEYTVSDRSYVFEWTSPEQEELHMTHEWCAEGVTPTIGMMQHLRLCDMPNWMKIFREGKPVVSSDWDAERERTPEEYALFDGQDIHSLIVIPIFSNQKFSGYIGLDNPGQQSSALSVRLLSSVGGHLGSLKENFHMVEMLKRQQEKQKEVIREQARQQKELQRALADANLNNEIINSISKIYWLIYRMDLMTGMYEEISAGQDVHRLTGKRGQIADVFAEVREQVVAGKYQEDMRAFLDIATLAQRLEETDSIAAEYQTRKGVWHIARFVVKKRDSSGNVTNVLYVVRELDRQKQLELEYRKKLLETAEDARRANMAKTDFLRRMSHDIRTPINGIQGMVAIAEHYPDDLEKQKECRKKVKEASGFLLDLVNSILDMNKLESGVVVLERQPFNLCSVLLETEHITQMNGDASGIRVLRGKVNVRHAHLIGSQLHLRQVLQNITGNAIKYNRMGGTIRLSCEELDCQEGKAEFRFICEDTGRGMSREFLEHAFEPFAQEDSSARTSYMGTGLGLSIARQLVELMGGTIQVESEVGIGSRFTLVIPFELDESRHEDNEEKEVLPEDVLRGKKVLLAEDNGLNMEIARFLLENAGMEVVSAVNGRDAVDQFEASEEGTFDLILMDIMMPVMDGLSAAREIRGLARSDARSVPIFAMTANAFSEDRRASREAGMNEHLSKPLNHKELFSAIRRYLVPKNRRESAATGNSAGKI